MNITLGPKANIKAMVLKIKAEIVVCLKVHIAHSIFLMIKIVIAFYFLGRILHHAKNVSFYISYHKFQANASKLILFVSNSMQLKENAHNVNKASSYQMKDV